MARRKRIKDTDYLHLSARIRAMERYLLTSARMDRMIEAPTVDDAVKVLGEIGYSDFSPDSEQALNAALSAEWEKVLGELAPLAPDRSVVDVFRVKYDYHNVKTVLKALAVGCDPLRLLSEAGRVPGSKVAEALREGEYDALPAHLAAAAAEAAEVLSTTGDPQRSDFVLDRAYFAEMLELADRSGSKFLLDYVQATVDSANLRGAVRTMRMKKDGDFLKKVLFPGGTIPQEKILAAAASGSLEELYRSTPLAAAAALGAAAVGGGSLIAFEKACDDAVTAVVAGAKRVPFGVEPLIAYLAAKEIEFTAVRIILTGRMAGLQGDAIRERLRESYV